MMEKSLILLCALAMSGGTLSANDEWLGNSLGTEHTAPVPFEKVSVDGASVKMWGKSFLLNDAALPERIVNQKLEMLTSPVTIFYEKDKNSSVELAPVPGSLKCLEHYDDYAVFEGKASDGILTCTVRTVLHFDGLVRITIQTAGDIGVKRFGILAPFRPDVLGPHFSQQFMGYSPDLIRATWGQAHKQKNFAYTQYLSLAGRETSVMILSECPRDWYLQRKSRVYQIEPDEDTFTFRANFIDVFGTAKAGGRTIDFGMLFGPSRPPVKDFRKYTVVWWEPKPVNAARLAGMGLKPLVLQWYFSTNGSAYQKTKGTPYARASRISMNIPEPEDPAGFREWLKETTAAGGIVCPYVNTDNFDPTRSPGLERLKEWAGKPIPGKFVTGENGFSPQDGFYVCHRSKTWADYYVHTLVKLAEEYGYKGYYIDNCASHECENPDHGPECKPYIDEAGKAWPRAPIFETRDLYLRLYRALKKINPEFLFFVNGGGYYPFWDFGMSAEYLTRIAGEEQLWPEFIDRGDIEGGFFRGQQSGPTRLIYPAYAGKNISQAATRAMLSITLHGDNAYQLSLSDTRPIEAFYAIGSKFGIAGAEFIPYWENKEYATAADKDILLSLYRGADSALLIASNPWKDSAVVPVSLAAYRIFPGYSGPVSVENAETGEKYGIESGMFFENRVDVVKIPLSKADYAILKITKQGKK